MSRGGATRWWHQGAGESDSPSHLELNQGPEYTIAGMLEATTKSSGCFLQYGEAEEANIEAG